MRFVLYIIPSLKVIKLILLLYKLRKFTVFFKEIGNKLNISLYTRPFPKEKEKRFLSSLLSMKKGSFIIRWYSLSLFSILSI